MIRRPPRSTLDRSSAASDVYKRQVIRVGVYAQDEWRITDTLSATVGLRYDYNTWIGTVSYTHLRAHETVLDLVCRLLLEKKK